MTTTRLPVRAHPARSFPRPPRNAEAGGVLPLVAVLLLGLIAIAALVGDGGNALTAKRRAINLAEQAARAGAQELDPASLRAGRPYRLDTAAARRAAERYLARAGVSGSATATTSNVVVTVTIQASTRLLGIIGIGQFTVTGTAAALPLAGISEGTP